MNEYISAIVLGLIEGITEFLPVSSTGHLLLAEHWLSRQSDLFNVVIQSGAVLAVLVAFSKRIRQFWVERDKAHTRVYLLQLGLSFLVTILGGLILHITNFELPESIIPVALATLVGGIAIIGVEYFSGKRKFSPQMTWKIAFLLGIGQLLAAMFPGLSRSGTTILVALALGVTRPAAVEFSFLLGVPTLLAAGVLKVFEAFQGHESVDWIVLLLGTLSSAITAFLTVKWLLNFVRSHTFLGFGWYRIVLGTLLFLFLK